MSTQYGTKPATAPVAPAAKGEEFAGPDVTEGMLVVRKSFGEGGVTRIEKAQKHIRVTFAIGEKTFVFPDAFRIGFIKMKE